MCSIPTPADLVARFESLDAAVAGLREVEFNNLDPAVRCRALERLETARRLQAVITHDIIGGLADEEPAHIGGPATKVVADWCRISYGEARRRVRDHAIHYLCVFDGHSNRPLYLGRSRRIASPDQRVVLCALERGCTHPGCDVPADKCEVHHIDEWATGGHTDIDKLTLSCTPHHKLIGKGWATTKLADNQTGWTTPKHLDPSPFPGQPRTNNYHHPERLFQSDEDP
jgi:hypothetical protein